MSIMGWWQSKDDDVKENFTIALNEMGTFLLTAPMLAVGAYHHFNDDGVAASSDPSDSSSYWSRSWAGSGAALESPGSDDANEWTSSFSQGVLLLSGASCLLGFGAKLGAYLLGYGFSRKLSKIIDFPGLNNGSLNLICDAIGTTWLTGGIEHLGQVMYHDLNEHYADDGWNRTGKVVFATVSLTAGVSFKAVPYALFFRQRRASVGVDHNILMEDGVGSDQARPES